LKSYTSLKRIQRDLNDGRISCVDLVNFYLENIKKKEHLNAFVEVYADEALVRATDIDRKIAAGSAGLLAGMVVGLKDVLSHENHHLRGGSRILDTYVAQFNATAVQRLLDQDAIIIGRNNCDEFAMGSSNENSAFGSVLNDADNERVPGGSSGGSAVAVQADMCLVSIGSDTGGSVRQPAAFCGILGLKPTYSRISRHGLIAYGSSFDCIGIFSRNLHDMALVLEVMAGADEFDSTVSQEDVPSYSKNIDDKKTYKIACISETLHADGLQPEIKEATLKSIEKLKNEGHTVEEVHFPLLEYILPTYYILTTAEASSNLSRYDGVRYGYRSPQGKSLEDMYKNTRSEGFGEEVKRRIMLGTFVLSASYYDAYYTKAQKARRLIRDMTKKILETHDFIVLPVTPTTAFKLGEHSADPLEMYLADLFTVQASVSGLPAISIPNGLDKEGLPIGFQVMADDFQEEKLLAFSNSIISS
jgi:aspartyl-tRNA(Asn)/glutamyl-tRNA(Gln) amidotransferase subunit A